MAFWKKKLAAIPLGITQAKFARRTGGSSEGSGSSGGGTSVIFRLDDHWVVNAFFSDPADKLTGYDSLERSLRQVWVEPAKDFTGRWVTYFVNGVTAHDIDYLRGRYRRFRSYYDNGQLVSEQRYVDGKIDGPEVGFHPDGKKAYEIRHAAGKHVGRWVHFYPNGQMQSVETWVNGVLEGSSVRWREDGTKKVQFDYRAGKETGQAAWDEQGALLYAHGTAERLRSPKPVAPRNP